jgi:hypothetical protein
MDYNKLATGLGLLAEKKAIDFVCSISPSDRTTLDIARAAKLHGQPDANRFLDHYLVGGGKDLEVDTTRLLREDSGVFRRLSETVAADLAAGLTKGVVPIQQSVFQNPNWKNATGSVNLLWEVKGESIEVWFVNKYRWHPTAKRVSQCIHEAADNLKTEGAQDYWMIGKHARFPRSSFQIPKVNP